MERRVIRKVTLQVTSGEIGFASNALEMLDEDQIPFLEIRGVAEEEFEVIVYCTDKHISIPLRAMERAVEVAKQRVAIYPESLGEMAYVAVIEKAADRSYSAYVPDLPGCVSCGEAEPEARQLIEQAVKLHVESLRTHGEPVPQPSATTHIVHVA